MTEHARPSLYTWLIQHSASRASLLIAFVWGLAEATIFFIVPDVYLGFVALFHWRQGLVAALAAVLGAMLGGVLMYWLSITNPSSVHELLLHVPLIKAAMLNTVSEQMRAEGLFALVSGPLQGIPYKIYAVQAAEQRLPLLLFLLATIPARLERILPVALLGALLGVVFHKFVQRHAALVLSMYVLLWLGIYLLYFVAVR